MAAATTSGLPPGGAPLLSACCRHCQQPVGPDTTFTCVACRKTVCTQCTSAPSPNRPCAVVCVRCAPAAAAPTAFPCGRCGSPIATDACEFFCDMCAAPLCGSCLPRCFEGGVAKCEGCCDVPVWRLLHLAAAATPTLVTEALLDSLPLKLRDVAAGSSGGGGRSSPQPMTPLVSASPYADMERGEELGKGAQGTVYRCRTKSGEEVVCKEMLFKDGDMAVFESQLRQARRMKELNHHHLIRYLDVFSPNDQPPRLCVVMPYYNEGDMQQFINRQHAPLKEWQLCSLVLQIDIALEYLHTQKPPLVHRDIKPANVLLLSKEDQVLLMDLDLCRSVDITASVVRGRMPSPTEEYRAPELARSAGSTKADIFSLGVLMYLLATLPEFPTTRGTTGVQMLLGAPDWTAESLESAIRRDVHSISKKMSNPYTYSEPFTQLLVDMLRHEPSQRPSATEVKQRLQRIMEQKLLSGKE